MKVRNRLFLLAVLFFTLLGICSAGDALADYTYAMSIKVNSGQVQNGPQTNFPFLFSSTNANLKTVANGGKVTNANGYDIIFKALDATTCGGAAPCTLSHEIEKYDGTSGEFIAWVKVPSINNGTVIYVYYGNSSISTSQENKTGVWDTNYKAVWHFPDGTTLTANDSTSGGNNASTINAVSAVGGKIGGGASFNGSNSWIDMGDGSINFAGNVTLESWVYPAVGSGGYKGIITKSLSGTLRDYTYLLNTTNGGKIYVLMGQTNVGDIAVSPTWSSGAWNHIVVTANGSDIYIYINGALAATVANNSSVSTTSSGDVFLGDDYTNSYPFWGYLDEARISNYARSADWIKTEYNNQNSPSSFYTLGSQLIAGSFNYRMSITVNSAQLPASVCTGGDAPPLTDFPFLFSSTSTNLKTVANGGNVTNANGYDIIFRSTDSTICGSAWDGKSCTLSHEVEKYDATTGQFIAWVKVPKINNGSAIYVYYGNPDVPSSTEHKTDVWDGNYKGVWHFPDGANLGLTDSIGNNTLTNNGTVAAALGKVYGAAQFNASNYLSKTSPSNTPSGGGNATIESWIYSINSGGTQYYTQFTNYGPTPTATSLLSQASYGSRGQNSPYAFIDGAAFYATAIFSDAVWYHVVTVYTASTVHIYINGADQILTDNNGTAVGNNTGAQTGFNSPQIWLGGLDGTTAPSNSGSRVDEVRISSSARSACWIVTEYNNQNLPDNNSTSSGFYYLNTTEESSPPTLITLSSFGVSTQGGIVWQTKSEVDNLGFNLYRTNPDGTGAIKLNSALIPGLVSSAIGKEYAYADTATNEGTTVCYMLEDIDLAGVSTYHGPICTFQPAPQSGAQVDGTSVQDMTGGGSGSYATGSAAAPGAQGTLPPSTGSVTAVKLQSLKASRGPEGVLIEWQTDYEVHNLGFHVYRDEGGRRVRLNKELLAGSALFAGTHAILRAGNAYSWFDPQGGAYWVEDVDLSGKRTLHGPIVPVPARGPLPWKKTLFLSEPGARLRTTALPFKILRMLTSANADFPGESISALETQWALAGTATMKVLIRQEGWYRLSFAQLVQAGFFARPRYIQLYADGKEQPILVTATGIEFYATGVDTQWTDTRSYWLVNGQRPGKRIDQASGGTNHAGPASFPVTVEEKPRSFYFPALLNGDAPNFFGPMITQGETHLTLTVSHKAEGEATLEVLLQGATDQNHNVSVFLNGSSLGSVVFDGQTQGHALFSVARSQLIEGVNQVSFVSSGEEDVSLVDTIRLTYQHTYTADGDHLRFTAAGGTTLTLTGFTQPVRIIDSTDPSKPQEVSGQLQKDGVHLKVPGTGSKRLLAVTEGAIQSPQLLANTPSTWHANHRADLVIITHGDFKASLAPLTQLRQRQGLSVAVVDIEDLYDEFSYGQKTPYAVKMFLSAAKGWTRPPRYVLLIGNATYDPRNYTGLGDFDFVPTKLVDTAMIETASDDWFVDFNTDGLPEIPIGRIPAVSAREVAQAVAKLISYEQSTPSTKALYVADIGDATDDFEGGIKHLESLTSLIPDELFRSKLQDQTAPTLLAELAKGAGLVTYLGHGSMGLWAGNVLDTTSASALTNTTFPFFIALTCLNGYFIIPTMDSLATTLLTDSAGGAVGVIASSSLTEFAPQEQLGTALLRDLFTGATVGEALLAAKHAVSDPDVRKSYLLFGDPSMRVRR